MGLENLPKSRVQGLRLQGMMKRRWMNPLKRTLRRLLQRRRTQRTSKRDRNMIPAKLSRRPRKNRRRTVILGRLHQRVLFLKAWLNLVEAKDRDQWLASPKFTKRNLQSILKSIKNPKKQRVNYSNKQKLSQKVFWKEKRIKLWFKEKLLGKLSPRSIAGSETEAVSKVNHLIWDHLAQWCHCQ
jgi:hypothetical protein